MAVLTRFVREEAIHRMVQGCPLARPAGSAPPTSACAGCPYNAAHSGQPRIGCVVRTPPEVLTRARDALEQRDERLAETFSALRRDSRSEEAPEAWTALARAWAVALERGESAHVDAEREIIAVIARFCEAAIRTGEPVELLR